MRKTCTWKIRAEVAEKRVADLLAAQQRDDIDYQSICRRVTALELLCRARLVNLETGVHRDETHEMIELRDVLSKDFNEF